jgi:hypothetical protein
MVKAASEKSEAVAEDILIGFAAHRFLFLKAFREKRI